MNPDLEQKIAQLIQEQQDSIIDRWVSVAKDVFVSKTKPYNETELIALCRSGLDAFSKNIQSQSFQAVEDYLNHISLFGVEQGFGIEEVVRGLFLTREAVEPVVHEAFSQEDAKIVFDRLDEVLHYTVGRLGDLYVGAMNRSQMEQQREMAEMAADNARLYEETRRRLAESELVQQVTAALLMKAELVEALQLVCAEATRITEASGAAVYLLDEDCLKVAFSTIPGMEVGIRIPLENTQLSEAVFLQQAVIHTGEIGNAQAPEYFLRKQQDSDNESMLLSWAAAPFRVKGEIIGILQVVGDCVKVTNDDLRALSLFADQAALAVESTRLHQEVEKMAVIEERQRLARELHDSVTQELYGMTLYAEAAARLLNSGHTQETAEYLRELRQTSQEALREMRLLIYELRPSILEHEGLIAALHARLESVEGRAGLQTEFHVEGNFKLAPRFEEDVYRIAQEALNNVLKHSQARHIRLSLIEKPDELWMEVQDDGVGFDLNDQEQGGLGLRTMHERCAKIGASLHTESDPGKGTLLRMILPVGAIDEHGG